MVNKPGEITVVQFQKMTEQEVWKLLTGRTGDIEVFWPGSDDERIDLEAQLKESFGIHISIQVKATSVLYIPNKARKMIINFSEKIERVRSHPLFWYFFGRFDMETLEFTSPVFLPDSPFVHEHATPRVHDKEIRFEFNANIEPTSRDQWREFKVEPLQLADRVREILEKAQANRSLLETPAPILAGSIVVKLKS